MQIAHCTTQDLRGPAKAFRLIPAGMFRTQDGRPQGVAGWVMDAQAAQAIISTVQAQTGDVLIDYEHQSLNSTSQGHPAPAAGWFKSLEWREGDGLYVLDARWTDKAAAMLSAKEYRYVSPVFQYDPTTGRVLKLHSAAITNTPALDGLTDLAAATLTAQASAVPAGISEHDHAKLQHIFGADYAANIASQDAAEQAALRHTPGSGLSAKDEATLQHVFGDSYQSC